MAGKWELPDAWVDAPLILGREPEQQVLGAALTRLLQGSSELVLISGEAGIGKTALTASLVSRAIQQNAVILTGAAYDQDVSSPYGLWREVLESTRRYPSLSPSTTPLSNWTAGVTLGSARDLWDSIQAFVAAIADQQPVLVVLEDLHWADDASLDVVRYLARQVAAIPVLLVATYRDVDLTPTHALYRLLPTLVREAQPTRITLRPLDRLATTDLIQHRYPSLAPSEIEQLVEFAERTAEGNPLFIEELFAFLEHEQVVQLVEDSWHLGKLPDYAVPPLVQQLIEERLGRLNPTALELLQVASVIGNEVPFQLWQRVSQATDETLAYALDEALQARILAETDQPDLLHFRHALIQEVAYRGTNLVTRRRLHEQAAAALADVPQVDPSRVAYHFWTAGDERAVDWLIEAARLASRAFAMQAAVDQYERALRLLEHNPTRQTDRAWVLCALAEAHRYTNTEQALKHVALAVEIAEQLANPSLAVVARWCQARLRSFAAEPALGELLAAEAAYAQLPGHEQAQIVQSPLGYVVSDATFASELVFCGQYHEAQRRAKRFLDAHASCNHRTGYLEFGFAYYSLARARAALGDPQGARAAFSQSRRYFQETGNHQLVGNCLHWELRTVLQVYYPDRPAERKQLRREEEQAKRQTEGAQSWDLGQLALDSDALILDGEWDTSRRIATMQLGIQANYVLGARKLAELDWRQGYTERAWSHVRAALAGGPTEEPGKRYFETRHALQRIAADLALDAGDHELAERWIAAYERWHAWSGKVIGQAIPEILRARLCDERGESQRARTHAERALELASAPRQPLDLLAAHRILASLQARSGWRDQAWEHLARALEIARACEAPHELALTQLVAVEVNRLLDSSEGADQAIAEIRTIGEQLGARPLLDRLEQLEKRSEPRTLPTALPRGLSGRELEVLRLVAQGLTDAEIGKALFISPRTVGGHLQSIYAKLDVTSRTAATAYAFEYDLL